MDCSKASEADRVPECGELFQWPNDKNPMRFMLNATPRASLRFPIVREADDATGRAAWSRHG
jgi:hypothetical protein